jgi:hypothetical protein
MTVSASCALTPLPDVAAAAAAPKVSRGALSPYTNFDSLFAAAKKHHRRR